MRRISKRAKTLCFMFLFIAIGLGYCLSQKLQINKYNVSLTNLPEKLDGIKIVQLSDLHRKGFFSDKRIKKAVEIANSQKPDIIVLTGDYISSGEHNIEPCVKLLSKLKARLGVYAVLGNHDHWTNSIMMASALEKAGIKVLIDANIEVSKGFYIIGVDDVWYTHPNFKKAFSGVPENASKLFLCHSPNVLLLPDCPKSDYMLLTGHTHGGQICIPGIPRNNLPGLKGWKWVSGWYRDGKAKLYVNKGVGMINPPIRFLCRPEVAVFTLNSHGSDGFTYQKPLEYSKSNVEKYADNAMIYSKKASEKLIKLF